MLTTLLALTLGASVCLPVASPRVPTLRASGDSIMQGGLCGVTGPLSPPAYLDTNLPGGTAGGWLVKNAGVTGTTPAQIRTAYTTDEATYCSGDRCAHLILEGGVNCLRASTAPATCLADMTFIVDDALSKGVAVVWLDVTDYSLWASAGVNPTLQATTYNTLWQAACDARASNPKLKCLANYAAMGVPLVNTCDGVHMNQAGTNSLGARILTALLSIP